MLAVADLHELGWPISHGLTPIPPGHIAAIDLGELDELQAKEREYAENEEREAISWDDRDRAIAEIHELREAQAAELGRRQTFLATAQELMPQRTIESPTGAIRSVSEALIRVKHLDDPEVAKAKSAKEAMRIIERKAELQAWERRAGELAKVQTHERHQLLLGAMEDLLPGLPNASIDVLITDPPYGVDAQDFGSQFTKEAHFDDSLKTWRLHMHVLAEWSVPKCKAEAHAYIFCDPKNFQELSEIFAAAGWYLWPWPLVWHKIGANGALPRPEHGPRRQYECILYAIKGDRRTLRIDSDVIAISPYRDSLHPHRKPRELYLNLLRRSARPGDAILDPFAGTGVVFEAANVMQLTALGIEKDPAMFAIAEAALRNAP